MNKLFFLQSLDVSGVVRITNDTALQKKIKNKNPGWDVMTELMIGCNFGFNMASMCVPLACWQMRLTRIIAAWFFC